MNEGNRFTMWLEPDERQALDEAAERLGVSRNKIARDALRNALGLGVDWQLLSAIIGIEEA